MYAKGGRTHPCIVPRYAMTHSRLKRFPGGNGALPLNGGPYCFWLVRRILLHRKEYLRAGALAAFRQWRQKEQNLSAYLNRWTG